MRHHSLNVSLKTLLATSCLIGHQLEDRSRICDSQDLPLFERLARSTARSLRSSSQRELFCVAPLDILVSQQQGRKQFHLLELNGTGIGGLTNMPQAAIHAVLCSLSQFCSSIADPNGVVLLAVSGKESAKSPRLNRLMHEKLLFVDAMRRGLEERYGDCGVATLGQLQSSPTPGPACGPTVVVGYIKELIDAMICDNRGAVWLEGRRVTGAVNDRFCRNMLQRFDDRVDLKRLSTLNRCFVAGSDKGVAYSLVNQFVGRRPHPALPREVRFVHAHSRHELIDAVQCWLSDGRQVVIKPHGTGLGHGIEFFLDPREPRAAIARRVDASLRQTEAFYGIVGGALPYTVCEYVDACRVEEPGHRLRGHKFELRVVVYRDGQWLRAMPSIAKIAREQANDPRQQRRSLINNITASGDTSKVCGTDYMLPLCNSRTLASLGLSESDLHDLCQFATGLVRHALDQVEDDAPRYGLPARPVAAPLVGARAA